MPDMMRILYRMAVGEARRTLKKHSARSTGPFKVAVYGGANLDVQARSAAAFRPGDSNPGSVTTAPGGVGRNIAENLARLGASVELVTALGDDQAARAIEASCEAAGIRLDRSLRLGGVPTPQYLCVLDADGRLVGAVAAMDAIEAFGPERLAERLAPGDEAELVVLDANLPAATIRAAAERWKGKPLVLDTVSVAKAVRAASSIGLLAAMKPNLAEARALLAAAGAGAAASPRRPGATADGAAASISARASDGLPAAGSDAVAEASWAASALMALGLGQAFVSLGAIGLLWADSGGMGLVRPPRLPVVNVSGAGDAATAALAWACVLGVGAREKAAFAAAAAALCAAAPDPVSKALSQESLLELAGKVEHEPVP